MLSDIVDLNRTFSELATKAKGEENELDFRVNRAGALPWPRLLESNRVIILSEAGSGKTTEIYQETIRQRESGLLAFFMRLEHVVMDFEGAFEIGTNAEFEKWLGSSEDAIFFFDSIDEARLKSPQDFELAVRKLSAKLSGNLHRVKIVITGRISAWRPVSDLNICNKLLGIDAVKVNQAEAISLAPSTERGLSSHEKNLDKALFQFKLVGLDDLSRNQKEVLLKTLGVDETKAFLESVERAGAESFTARPQDLEELSAYWRENNTIGNRTEFTKFSIDRRLIEREQTRAEHGLLSSSKVIAGVKLLAAATTLMQNPLITVPDGSLKSHGIRADDILVDWSANEILELLSRPIFDEAIYGNVRFHHRTVREFLTAEWLKELLENQAARKEIESLFFTTTYGLDSIVPTWRHILPWLILLDREILNKAIALDPEIVFEEGDPVQLPQELRQRILHQICNNFDKDDSKIDRHAHDAIERFVNTDLYEDISLLLVQYRSNREALQFLLRMVWVGKVNSSLSTVKEILNDGGIDNYTESLAIEALGAIGSDRDICEVRELYSHSEIQVEREVFRTLIKITKYSNESFEWFKKTISNVQLKKQHHLDILPDEVAEFLGSARRDQFSSIVGFLNETIGKKPHINHASISREFSWLITSAEMVLEKMISARMQEVAFDDALDLLIKVKLGRHYCSDIPNRANDDIEELIENWPELNQALFWYGIRKARHELLEKGESVKHFQDAWRTRSYWSIKPSDFDYWSDQLMRRELIDDKLVALSVAFQLYVDRGRKRRDRERLKKQAAPNTAVSQELHLLLNPKPLTEQEKARRNRQLAADRQYEKQKQRREKQFQDFTNDIVQKMPQLKESIIKEPGKLNRAISFLFENSRSVGNKSDKWGGYDWENLEPKFGMEIAEYYRDAIIVFWRNNKLPFKSVNDKGSLILRSTIIGLAGIQAEWRQNQNIFTRLTDEEVVLACRYSSFELNGFPFWFKQLYDSHPNIVKEFLLKQVGSEIYRNSEKDINFTVLNKIVHSAPWICHDMVSEAISMLVKEPSNTNDLDCLLKILKSSKEHNGDIVKLASRKVKTIKKIEHLARWIACWVWFEPQKAIPFLELTLANITEPKKRTNLCMHFVGSLLEGRVDKPISPELNYQTPEFLEKLYMLMVENIRIEDDINRFHEGAYTPKLRDRAQDGRNSLLNSLEALPGKRAFLALQRISETHPNKDYRIWIRKKAYWRAVSDGAMSPWSSNQVLEFQKMSIRTPATHRQLAECASKQLFNVKHELEEGDTSLAELLTRVKDEPEMRVYLAKELRDKSQNRYSIAQEDELADGKKPDIRFLGNGFDAPVPLELKLANKWPGPKLIERLENQLCGDYLRDDRSSRGLYVLIYTGTGPRSHWQLPSESGRVDFGGLIDALRSHWDEMSRNFPNIEDVTIIGIDLTIRSG